MNLEVARYVEITTTVECRTRAWRWKPGNGLVPLASDRRLRPSTKGSRHRDDRVGEKRRNRIRRGASGRLTCCALVVTAINRAAGSTPTPGASDLLEGLVRAMILARVVPKRRSGGAALRDKRRLITTSW